MPERFLWAAGGGVFCGSAWGWLTGSIILGVIFSVAAFLALVFRVWSSKRG